MRPCHSGGARPCAIAVALTWLSLAGLRPSVAVADDDSVDSSRPWHGFVGVGSFAAIVGDRDVSATVQVELLPGGRLGHFGVRGDVRWARDGAPDWFTVGLLFEAGASRPRLQITLHGDVGVIDGAPAVGAGATIHLGIVGPLAIGLDGSSTLRIDGVDNSSLILSSSLTLGLAR